MLLIVSIHSTLIGSAGHHECSVVHKAQPSPPSGPFEKINSPILLYKDLVDIRLTLQPEAKESHKGPIFELSSTWTDPDVDIVVIDATCASKMQK